MINTWTQVESYHGHFERSQTIGENATLELVKILLANNKIKDIDKIYNDKEYRNKLMEEYKIYEMI